MSRSVTFLLTFVGDQLSWLEPNGTYIPLRIYAPNTLAALNPDEREAKLYELLSPSNSRIINQRTLFTAIAETASTQPPQSEIILQAIRTSDGNIWIDYSVSNELYIWLINNYTEWSDFNVGSRNWDSQGYRFYLVL